ncbi:TetR/AcrR family transcriptional regulator [Gallaecimonas kandeliae]|uniref:TetR/AcrR family transcriptional regulator n=1 Tax=Gallaecimonas kandeliae TaxID=3029055 RepID=UPI00264759E5|nr:TetR/AcrR family transcriptional regulator [Gallaecimonas kandeliae]WKE64748.1 TetR/AcrR family transcriptional regulator [Gallaecimonas kandeliae]
MSDGSTIPRKRPSQDRSRATVAALIEATAQVLIAHGYHGTTTAKVAQRAGVSVGSLYQYFPNKDALVVALIEHHATRLAQMMDEALGLTAALSLEQSLRQLITTALDRQRLSPELHKILVEQVPRVGGLQQAMDTSQHLTKQIGALLKRHSHRLPKRLDPDIAAHTMETVLEALTHKAVTAEPASLENGCMADEIYQVLAGYLGLSHKA